MSCHIPRWRAPGRVQDHGDTRVMRAHLPFYSPQWEAERKLPTGLMWVNLTSFLPHGNDSAHLEQSFIPLLLDFVLDTRFIMVIKVPLLTLCGFKWTYFSLPPTAINDPEYENNPKHQRSHFSATVITFSVVLKTWWLSVLCKDNLTVSCKDTVWTEEETEFQLGTSWCFLSKIEPLHPSLWEISIGWNEQCH